MKALIQKFDNVIVAMEVIEDRRDVGRIRCRDEAGATWKFKADEEPFVILPDETNT